MFGQRIGRLVGARSLAKRRSGQFSALVVVALRARSGARRAMPMRREMDPQFSTHAAFSAAPLLVRLPPAPTRFTISLWSARFAERTRRTLLPNRYSFLKCPSIAEMRSAQARPLH